MLDYESISKIVTTLTWDNLLGQIEGDFIDCKREVYDLDPDRNKIELAKDITSFANADGGFILIGIQTQQSQTHFSDEIVSFSPFKANTFNPKKYEDILNQWVYPRLTDVRIEWKAKSKGTDRGFGVITVPPQPDTKKPFLISKSVLASGKRTDILFGYAERKRDRSEPATLTELHAYVRDGMQYQVNISNRLAAIEARLPVKERPSHLPPEELAERVRNNLEAIGLNTRKHYVLVGYPCEPTELISLFSSSPDSISSVLENPPTIREAAFSPTTSDTAKIIDGKFRRVSNHSRKVVDLYSDGCLIFGCAADEDFLAWGTKNFEERPKLNIIALVEATYHFCLLYSEVLARLSPKPEQVSFRFEFGNMRPDNERSAVFLVPYRHDALAQRYGDPKYFATKDNFSQELQVLSNAYDPGSVAYMILEHIFRYFGVESDFIVPYSEQIDGKMVISAEQIRSLR